jgi:hypothetical protein
MGSRIWAAVALAATCSAAHVAPRAAVTDYRSHKSADTFAIGAEVQRLALLNPGRWLVVEVAAFPAAGTRLAIATGDFALKVADRKKTHVLYPLLPAEVAEALAPPAQTPRPIEPPHGSVEAGATWGRAGTNPGQPVSEKHASTEISMGVPDRPPAPAPQERRKLAHELSEQALPEGAASAPVAGYLYFQLPAKKLKKPRYTLQYEGPAGKLDLEDLQ